MNRTIKLIYASTALAAVAAISIAAGNLQGTLQSSYSQLAVATRAGDSAKAEKVLRGQCTKDFKSIDKTGKTKTLEQVIAEMKRGMAQIGKYMKSCTITLKSVNQNGNTAVGQVASHYAASLPGQGGKMQTLDMTEMSTDSWIKVGNDWKMKQTKISSQVVKIDGKTLNLDAPMPKKGKG